MYAEYFYARHIFLQKKLVKHLEIQKILLYLCDIKMISVFNT